MVAMVDARCGVWKVEDVMSVVVKERGKRWRIRASVVRAKTQLGIVGWPSEREAYGELQRCTIVCAMVMIPRRRAASTR